MWMVTHRENLHRFININPDTSLILLALQQSPFDKFRSGLFPSTLLYDIALLRLEFAVNFGESVRPACLPTSADQTLSGGEIVTVTGFGYDASDTFITDQLRVVSRLKLTTFQACEHI